MKKKPQSFWLSAEFAPFREAGGTSCVKWWSGSKVICCFLYWHNNKKRCLGSEQIVDHTVTSGVTNLEAAVAFDTSALWISHFSGSKGNQKWSTAVPAVLSLLPSAFVVENMVSSVFLHLTKFRWLGLGQRKFPFCKEYKKLPSVSMGNFQWVMTELVRKM